jgi:hypothetical protein
MHLAEQLMQKMLSVSPMLLSVVKCDILSVSLSLILWKYASPKANAAQKQGEVYGNPPKPKWTHNVLKW